MKYFLVSKFILVQVHCITKEMWFSAVVGYSGFDIIGLQCKCKCERGEEGEGKLAWASSQKVSEVNTKQKSKRRRNWRKKKKKSYKIKTGFIIQLNSRLLKNNWSFKSTKKLLLQREREKIIWNVTLVHKIHKITVKKIQCT